MPAKVRQEWCKGILSCGNSLTQEGGSLLGRGTRLYAVERPPGEPRATNRSLCTPLFLRLRLEGNLMWSPLWHSVLIRQLFCLGRALC